MSADIRQILLNLADEKLKIFCKKLIFNPEILGVNTPKIRALAKKLNFNSDKILKFKPLYHEEFILKGFLIINLTDEKAKFNLSSEFIKDMPNWAVCDSFNPKFKDAKFIKKLLDQSLASNLEFEKRFFYVYFMRNLTGFNLDEFFKICTNEKDERYYVQMAIAWALSELFIKYPDRVKELLKSKKLNTFTHNKTIQKIRESYRVSKILKDEINKFKLIKEKR